MKTSLRWTFFVPGIPFVGDTLKHSSLGGSETAALCLGRELVKLGDSVFMFTGTEQAGAFDGVYYLPATQFQAFATTTPHDVCVVQRSPDQFAAQFAAKLNVMWQHDLTLGRQRQLFQSAWWNVDKVALLSDYMVKQYKEVLGMDEDLVFRTRNGVDLADFEPHKGLPRDPYKLLYTSRPERGLENLLERIMPALWEKDPKYRLYVSAYDNRAAHLDDIYAKVQQLMARHADRVTWLGHLKREQLYEHYATAHLLVYPTPSPSIKQFAEISWITGMECQASGLPLITTRWGAAPETVPNGAGTLLDGMPWDEGYTEKFVDSVLSYRDSKVWGAASKAGIERAQSLSWTGVAEQWRDMAITEIKARNTDKDALARYFIGHGSSVPSACLLEASKMPASPTSSMLRDVTTPRIEMLVDVVRENQPRTFLDLTPGAHDDALRDLFPEMDVKTSVQGGRYDMVFSADAVHIAAEPAGAISAMENLTNPGGQVVFMVPYGPVDRIDQPVMPGLWEIELPDIQDMLEHKKADVQSAATGKGKRTQEPHGWHRVRYTADHTSIGAIDWDRKLSMQRPIQSVELNMIVGGPNAADTLGWSLKSIAPFVDVIRIGDTGMTEQATAIAQQYDAVIHPVPNPLEAGFDEARNALLDRATCQWILWMDSDERLLGGEAMAKYLRRNVFAGYSIRQHHFAIDAGFDADMPVRLFRREGWKGDPMRFIGRIHEHPELGMNVGPGPVVILGDMNIAHVGYLDESIRRVRFARNHPLLQKDIADYPDRLLQKHFIMRDNMLLVGYQLSQNGGVVTAEMQSMAKEVVELYREHFIGKPKYANVDGLQYYTSALSILGEGIDVQFAINAGRDGAMSGDPPIMGRFANLDEASTEIKTRLEGKVKPLEATIW